MTTPDPLHDEPHDAASATRLNWLRAGVLGANDGSSPSQAWWSASRSHVERGAIATAGLAGLVAGAVSMALGEYISVSSQRDSESAQLALERRELEDHPGQELEELAAIYRAKGLSESTAHTVALELTAHDAMAAHADAELHIDPDELANPWQAAGASVVAFTTGALLPLLAILLAPAATRVPVTVVAVLVALALTGVLSSRIGSSPSGRAVLRVVVGGALGLTLTWLIGRLFGTALG